MARQLPAPLPLWAGRSMALVGILLVAFNVRTAVSAISPIVDSIVVDLPLDGTQLGIIGTVPPIAFAFAALAGGALARRVGVERLLTLAIVAMVLGHIVRAASDSFAVLLLGTALALAGAGIGNVLLPPLVKRYFPDRIGLVTALYVSLVSASSAAPPAVVGSVTELGGWRLSLAIWAVASLVCLLPWAVILLRHRRERALAEGDASPAQPHVVLRGLPRSRVAWSIALIFALSSAHVYAAFAWLPIMLVDIAGVTPLEAGMLLGLYGLMGVPTALVTPIIAARVRNVSVLVFVGLSLLSAGYLGFLFLPTAAVWLWVVLAGLGGLLFPLALTLINLRSHTQQGSVALSGFVQGIGYAVAALGPLLFGLFHDLSGGWTLPMLFLLVVTGLGAFAGWQLRKPIFIEDELAGR